MKYKGMIFDFNGVLWWDTEIQEAAWQETAVKLRGHRFTDKELEIHLHGRNNKHTLEFLIGKEINSKERLDELTQLKEQNYRDKCLQLGNKFKLSPGAIEYLDYLTDLNIPITIATASEINNLKFFFKYLNLDTWFDIKKVIYDDSSRPGKPAPDNYLAAANNINIAPQSCIVIEDALSGIESAKVAGIGYVIGIGTSQTKERLLQKGADHFINRLDEVIDLDLF